MGFEEREVRNIDKKNCVNHEIFISWGNGAEPNRESPLFHHFEIQSFIFFLFSEKLVSF